MQQTILILICYFILIYISMYDIIYKKISNRVLILFACICLLSATVDGGVGIGSALAGAGSIAGFLITLNLVVRAFGGGDIKLLAAGGLSLGPAGIWQAFAIAILTAGIWCVIRIVQKRLTKESKIPMGIFFSVGMILAWMKTDVFR